jgi:hypothetical protein
MAAFSVYRLNQVLCLTTSSSPMTPRWPRHLRRRPGASTRRYVSLFAFLITFLVDQHALNILSVDRLRKLLLTRLRKRRKRR